MSLPGCRGHDETSDNAKYSGEVKMDVLKFGGYICPLRHFRATCVAVLIADIFLCACMAGDVIELRPELQVALALKVLPFAKAKNLDMEKIRFHVMGSKTVAEKLKSLIGGDIGKARIVEVTEGSELPAVAPSVIYIGGKQDLAAALDYAKRQSVLTLTGNPEIVENGPAIGIGGVNDKPKIFVNLATSKDEGIQWEPAIFKIATTVK